MFKIIAQAMREEDLRKESASHITDKQAEMFEFLLLQDYRQETLPVTTGQWPGREYESNAKCDPEHESKTARAHGSRNGFANRRM